MSSSPQGFSFPPPLPVLIPSAQNHSQPSKVTWSFLCIFRAYSSPEPFRKTRNKGFLGNVSLTLSGRGRKSFRGDFSGRFFWNFRSHSERFPKLFLWKKFGKRRGKEGGKGGEDVVEWGKGEEKLKSAIRKNEFCDHIVFLQKPVFGEM